MEGATPGQVAGRGQGLVLRVAALPTPWGRLFAAQAPRGLAFAAFVDQAHGLARARRELRRLWPKAALREDAAALRSGLGRFQQGRGSATVWVPGTPFQLQVWRALVRVPSGARLSYQGLARAAGVAGPRAVGSAVAANPVALFIPCHRVLRASGAVGEYHWGAERKRALLAWEAGRAAESPGLERPERKTPGPGARRFLLERTRLVTDPSGDFPTQSGLSNWADHEGRQVLAGGHG